jgi:hypothetical protein
MLQLGGDEQLLPGRGKKAPAESERITQVVIVSGVPCGDRSSFGVGEAIRPRVPRGVHDAHHGGVQEVVIIYIQSRAGHGQAAPCVAAGGLWSRTTALKEQCRLYRPINKVVDRVQLLGEGYLA